MFDESLNSSNNKVFCFLLYVIVNKKRTIEAIYMHRVTVYFLKDVC